MQYVWIGVLVASLVVEAATTDLVAIWFFPAALVSMILAFCHVPWWVQFVVFVALGILLFVLTRPFCRKFLANKKSRTNAEALVGKKCIVTEEIHNILETGEVKVDGLRWSARTLNEEEIIKVGEIVRIAEIRGVKLIVARAETEEKGE